MRTPHIINLLPTMTITHAERDEGVLSLARCRGGRSNNGKKRKVGEEMDIGGSVEGVMAFVNEISSLKVELCRRDMESAKKDAEIARLMEEADGLREALAQQQARCERLEMELMGKNMEANFFRAFYLLSTKKVKRIFMMLRDMHARSFLHSCICSCLPDNVPAEVRYELDDLMTLPVAEEQKRVDINVQGNLQAGELRSERTDVRGDSYDIHDNPNARFKVRKVF